jgi:hypothetical protein
MVLFFNVMQPSGAGQTSITDVIIDDVLGQDSAVPSSVSVHTNRGEGR